jgi:hypothetical protein
MTFVDQTAMFNDAVDRFLHPRPAPELALKNAEECEFWKLRMLFTGSSLSPRGKNGNKYGILAYGTYRQLHLNL